jgi:SAM-dependent methyltransferase
MQVTIAPQATIAGGFRELDENRSGFAEHFAKVMASDPRLRGRVLDVGCGKNGPDLHNRKGEFVFFPVIKMATQLDGLDPFPEVVQNPHLKEKWVGTLEQCPVPEGAYDALLSFFVLEHVGDTQGFLRAAFKALKPGGVFYALTPSANHPFAWAVKVIETFNVKRQVERISNEGKVNRIPTYYRLNSPSTVAKAAAAVGFGGLEVFYYPALNWETYFPRPLRIVPRTYDRLIGTRYRGAAQQILFKLEKPK